jgi:Mce-associated membrane protein
MTTLRIPTAPRTLAALAAAVVLAGTAAVTLTVQASSSDSAGRVDNEAFLDAEATSLVMEQTRQTVGRAFTFGPESIPAAKRAARRSLVGGAVRQYAQLYEPLFKQGRSVGLSVTTAVRSVGVESLSDDRAELLVLADQTASTPDGQSTTGAAQLAVSAERQDGQWKVARIQLL